MAIQKRTVIYVSDGTGITAETLGHGLLSQFEGIEYRPLRFPFIDSEDKARECLARINDVNQREGVHPIVILTQTNQELSAILHKADAFFIDMFDSFIAPLEQELGSPLLARHGAFARASQSGIQRAHRGHEFCAGP